MTKPNFKRNILEATGGEVIEGVVIGEAPKYCYVTDALEDEKDPVPSFVRNKVLMWHEAEKYLNYDYNAGLGGLGCHAVYAWTPNRIIFVSEYDGAHTVCVVPRHPVNAEPKMYGGG